MTKQFKPALLFATLAAVVFSASVTAAQGKDAPRCVSADGKEKMSADGKPITTKTACEKAGGTLQSAKK